MNWISLLAGHFRQGLVIIRLSTEFGDRRARRPRTLGLGQKSPRNRQGLRRSIQANQQIDQHLGGECADGFRVRVFGFGAKMSNPLLDLFAG